MKVHTHHLRGTRPAYGTKERAESDWQVGDLDILREFLSYEPDTGLLRWKVNRSYVKAGAVAGTKCPKRGYITVAFAGRRRYVHRVAWLLAHGSLEAGLDIDHINGDRSDNRLCNLRLATRSQNLCNSKGHAKTSRFKGVASHARRRKWRAFLGKRHLGSFESEVEAARAADCAAKEAYGEFARLNFPEEIEA